MTASESRLLGLADCLRRIAGRAEALNDAHFISFGGSLREEADFLLREAARSAGGGAVKPCKCRGDNCYSQGSGSAAECFGADIENRDGYICRELQHEPIRGSKAPKIDALNRVARPEEPATVTKSARAAGETERRGSDTTADGLLKSVETVSVSPVPTLQDASHVPPIERDLKSPVRDISEVPSLHRVVRDHFFAIPSQEGRAGELRACPFCGAVPYKADWHKRAWFADHTKDCPQHGLPIFDIEAWNTRAPLEKPSGEAGCWKPGDVARLIAELRDEKVSGGLAMFLRRQAADALQFQSTGGTK